MAQVKTRSSSKSTRSRPKAQSNQRKPPTRSRGSSKRASPKSKPSSQQKSQNGKGRLKAVEQVVESKGKDAGQAVGKAAKAVGRARTPLIASGASVVAGVAGGLAIGALQHRNRGGKVPRKVSKLKPEDIAKGVRQAAKFTENAGQVAGELRRASEQSNGESHRSPIEVLLRGLTERR